MLAVVTRPVVPEQDGGMDGGDGGTAGGMDGGNGGGAVGGPMNSVHREPNSCSRKAFILAMSADRASAVFPLPPPSSTMEPPGSTVIWAACVASSKTTTSSSRRHARGVRCVV